jgi:hypothetical protein
MKKRWSFVILFCLTLGLAPWWLNGEPHIIGKVKWVLGGAEGMKAMDYFDLFLHGSPWLFLVWKLVQEFLFKKKEEETSS